MTELAFDIPYIFHVRGIPKRGTKERTEFAFETIPAVVRVIPSDDAPLAAVFPPTLGDRTYIGEGGQVALRLHGGRLYAKALTEYYDRSLDVTPDMLSTFLDRGVYAVENSDRLRTVLPDAPGTIHRGLFPETEAGNNPIRPFVEDKWQSWSSKDRVENRANAERLYDNLIVIDGVFWRAVPEPVYVLGHYRDDHLYTHVSTAIAALPEAEKRGKDSIFGLTSWDRLTSEAAERYGITPEDTACATIFIEDAFSYDSTTEIFVEHIAKATDHDGDLLKSFDIESMTRWAAMRDALALARSVELEPVALDALASAAERYATGPKASKWAIDLINKALAVHDRHTVDIRLTPTRRP
ncbi:hypothetical protein OIU34_21830 [Pararhizobium sp. BT-229]|uniref:hypothetical protein n=1 Tax=Pararhizobium sp. BT-229 TaxID=2986923 RepID=UPI0021F70150|nr:hypothetical protein [Pararhizobium sp. BT-229]MCV9964534.1 hypothetical protein [Pararhizobium sp. BT-229]